MLSNLYPFLLLLLFAAPALGNPVHSAAKPDDVAIKHLHLNLKADFSTKQLSGSATLTLDRKSDSTKLRLDMLGLTINSVKDAGGKLLDYSMEPFDSYLGRPLEIELGEKSAGVSKVVIEYSTRPGAEALQWLSPEQTTGGKHPFLFTQSQAILARTWVPCQDTPAVRITYSAHIEVPKDLMAVMSASNPVKKSPNGHYDFEMKQPIPSYLLALAIGDLEFKSIGPRSGVYAEPNVIEKAAWELADTEAMIEAAEKLYGPYRWDRYDVIFLPPSFPFGGMENPRLTFATPTILAGDRSLVALIAHELAHSWSGNLVTNATWDDFWLNEGFTVYFEQRIMEAVYGRKYSEMLAKLALESLKEELQSLTRRDTWLKLDLRGRNPDDGMTGVAYDKGYLFLRMLEETVGREKWDSFLKEYFTQFSFQSMTTESCFVKRKNKKQKTTVSKMKQKPLGFGPGRPDNSPHKK
ncbi:MAG: M1 family aminopeptidase/hydrolase, partial [Planctomycetota bacterium]